MSPLEVVDQVVREHTELHEALALWEAALRQLTSESPAESRVGLDRLWRLLPFFDRELPRHFREEEAGLFAELRARRPESEAVLRRYAAEHAHLGFLWSSYKQELLYCDVTGDRSRIGDLTQRLITQLRTHMNEEERVLLPLLEGAEIFSEGETGEKPAAD